MTDQNDTTGCCTPGRDKSASAGDKDSSTTGAAADSVEHDMIDLPGATFAMGTDDAVKFPGDGEDPSREVSVGPFRLSRYAVSNREFGQFISSTGYVTDAQRFEWSFVFHLFLPDDFPDTRAAAAAPWWRQVYGADWSHPAGPQSDLDGLDDHPVVHVSWNDAQAYCEWAGTRLSTEAEWEYAARGGLVGKRYVWGDEFAPGGQTMCNIFEGTFPIENTAEDGYVGTAPVDAFPPNGFGFHNMAGNVWEWCADWFHTNFHRTGPTDSPTGPPSGEAKVMRGGSYMCHDSYCDRYRVSARSSNTIDSSTGNLGFRVAADSASSPATGT